jgi:hypothetical protein
VTAPELDRAAALCALAEQKAREAAICLPEQPGPSAELARSAGKDSAAALALLRGLGADPMKSPGAARSMPSPRNPFAELARVENSRAEALALLDALRHAHQLAEALDAKRGDVLDEPIGGSAGLVWGDRLIQAVCGLELELFGPSGSVTGGRE